VPWARLVLLDENSSAPTARATWLASSPLFSSLLLLPFSITILQPVSCLCGSGGVAESTLDRPSALSDEETTTGGVWGDSCSKRRCTPALSTSLLASSVRHQLYRHDTTSWPRDPISISTATTSSSLLSTIGQRVDRLSVVVAVVVVGLQSTPLPHPCTDARTHGSHLSSTTASRPDPALDIRIGIQGCDKACSLFCLSSAPTNLGALDNQLAVVLLSRLSPFLGSCLAVAVSG